MASLPTVIITGASRGIGKGLAVHLAKRKEYKLCLIARNGSLLQETERLCKSSNSNIVVKCISCDIADTRALKAALLGVCTNFGPLQVLINNAGVGGSGVAFDADLDQWDKMLDVNLRASIHATTICLPYLKQCKSNATVINIGSILSTPHLLNPSCSMYAATKYGMLGFNDYLFEDVKSSGIKVSCIMPGVIDTPLIRGIPKYRDAAFENMIKITDIAKAVQYILDTSDCACPTQILIKNSKALFKLAKL